MFPDHFLISDSGLTIVFCSVIVSGNMTNSVSALHHYFAPWTKITHWYSLQLLCFNSDLFMFPSFKLWALFPDFNPHFCSLPSIPHIFLTLPRIFSLCPYSTADLVCFFGPSIFCFLKYNHFLMYIGDSFSTQMKFIDPFGGEHF